MLKVCDHLLGPVLLEISNCSSFSLTTLHYVIMITVVYSIYIFFHLSHSPTMSMISRLLFLTLSTRKNIMKLVMTTYASGTVHC